MHATLISIGDEILNGTTINTNASWISTQLQPLGVDIKEVLAISDDTEHILQTLDRYVGRMEIIIITGGLGPTKDDITKKTLCTFFNSILEFHDDIYEKLKAAFAKRNIPFTENNRDQAMYPHNCEILPNSLGTAQGMLFRSNGSVIVSLPGVPFEMKGLMSEQVMPRLRIAFSFPQIVNRYFMTSGISESFLAKRLEPLEAELPDHIGLAYLPSPGVVKLRLTARGLDEGPLLSELDSLSELMRNILRADIYAETPITIEEHIGNMLTEAGMTLGTAESCTGGKIAHKITSVPGSSNWFIGGVVPYSNQLKNKILGVPESTIATYGAVSEESVSAMLDGALKLLGSDFAIAVSGIAGPTGGSPEKPVGMVWIGAAGSGKKVVHKYFFNKNREINIEYACMFALHELRLLLTDILVKPS